ncbi:hypothetical protein ACOSQ2_028487 [Xanthoceras sorbifolium]
MRTHCGKNKIFNTMRIVVVKIFTSFDLEIFLFFNAILIIRKKKKGFFPLLTTRTRQTKRNPLERARSGNENKIYKKKKKRDKNPTSITTNQSRSRTQKLTCIRKKIKK